MQYFALRLNKIKSINKYRKLTSFFPLRGNKDTCIGEI